MTAEMQLATVPPKETALQVYSAENGLEPYLQIIKAEIDAFVPDTSTRKGREAIASIAYKVARSKTALDNAGKDLVAELKEVPKKIDAERKRMRDLLDVWQAEVRKPLTEWEEAEKARVDRIQAQVSRLADTDVTEMSAADIKVSINNLEAHAIDARYEEFEAEAHRVKAASLATLRDALAKREQYEAEQAELERLRAEAAAREQKEREERIAREAAEAERLAAERRAQEERDAATRRELELKLQAEQAERAAAQAEASRVAAEQRAEQERIDAEERASQAVETARQAEIKRQADEQARIKAEADAREADRAHKSAVLKAAKEAVMTVGVTEDQAREVIKLIAAGGVPRVYISY